MSDDVKKTDEKADGKTDGKPAEPDAPVITGEITDDQIQARIELAEKRAKEQVKLIQEASEKKKADFLEGQKTEKEVFMSALQEETKTAKDRVRHNAQVSAKRWKEVLALRKAERTKKADEIEQAKKVLAEAGELPGVVEPAK